MPLPPSSPLPPTLVSLPALSPPSCHILLSGTSTQPREASSVIAMSRVAKFTLGAAVFSSALIVWGVHHLQMTERENMYQGIVKDDERRREKMRQREEEFQRSLQKRELYERVQTVSNPAPNPSGST
ncbi:hypothetical protein LXA43DRAFT_218276 [Ganoderma leucocontextum]|nr:hypothetical protein LXA43DRAFT_218276 [Ganoderma leucocontextum]